MELRSTKVAQVPFMKIGGLTEIQEENRRQELLAEFRALCPYSRALTGSELGTRKDYRDTGTVLEFHLRETPQAYLHLVAGTPIHPIGAAHDMFSNDITLVTQEIHRFRALIRTAVNPAISLDMLREKSAIGDQIRFIRRRLRKRSVFYLPTLEEQPIAVPRFSQQFFGPAVTVQVEGTVTALFRRGVELTDAKMHGTIPDQLTGIEIPARILMSRKSAQKKPEQLIIFANKLDSGDEIDVVVGVNLDAVNGRPTSLRFQGFPAE